LAIGAVPPETFDNGTYVRCSTAACDAASPAVVVYLHSASALSGTLDERTIFAIDVNGSTTFLINQRSMVDLGDYAFRNPPHFVSFTEPAARDAQYETEALFDHLYYHQNTLPFVAYRLIQRLVTSVAQRAPQSIHV
jgi:hypothetical protein